MTTDAPQPLPTTSLDAAGAAYRDSAMHEISVVHHLSASLYEVLRREPLDVPAVLSIGHALDRSFKDFGGAIMQLGAVISSEGTA